MSPWKLVSCAESPGSSPSTDGQITVCKLVLREKKGKEKKDSVWLQRFQVWNPRTLETGRSAPQCEARQGYTTRLCVRTVKQNT